MPPAEYFIYRFNVLSKRFNIAREKCGGAEMVERLRPNIFLTYCLLGNRKTVGYDVVYRRLEPGAWAQGRRKNVLSRVLQIWFRGV
jgi:hypothetical protein